MSHAAKLAAYSSAQAHGGVAAADPHRLIVMLLDGAIERISTARGCMARGDTSEKARLINRAVSIIGELRNSLDLEGRRPARRQPRRALRLHGPAPAEGDGGEPRRDARRGQQAPARDPHRVGSRSRTRRASDDRADRRRRDGGDAQARATGHDRPVAGSAEDDPGTARAARTDLVDRAPAGPAVAGRSAPGHDRIGCRRRPDGASRRRLAALLWVRLQPDNPSQTTDAVATVMDMLGKGG